MGAEAVAMASDVVTLVACWYICGGGRGGRSRGIPVVACRRCVLFRAVVDVELGGTMDVC